MKNLKFLLFLLVVTIMPIAINATVFVNDRAPGVHQTSDPKTGEKIWANSLGHKIAPVEGTKTMADFDKADIAYASDKVQQDIVYKPKENGITKVWDNYRNCYVWKSKTGDYLGRVPDELQQKEWEKNQKEDWEKDLSLTDAAKNTLKNTNNGWGSAFGIYDNLFDNNQKDGPNDNIDCSKELNEILSDPHMNVQLAKERLEEGGLTPSQKKALEKYIEMGGKKGKEEKIDPKKAAAEIAHAEAELKKIEKARAELKALGGYDEFAADFERYEAELRATIKKYKGQ